MKWGLTIALCAGLLMAKDANAQARIDLKTQKDRISYTLGQDVGDNLKARGVEGGLDLLMRGVRDAGSGGRPPVSDLKSPKETLCYLVGRDLGKFLKRQAVEIDLNLILRGAQDALSGKSLMAETEKQAARTALQTLPAEKNRREAEAFLSKNSRNPGVITLPSGLQYRVIRDGAGKSPRLTDVVTAHYRGTLIDGTEFDSSLRQGKPVNFLLRDVIPGWQEALQLMRVGAKWQMFVPANLAYGARGKGRIPPHAALIFEIELIAIR